jgi:hypothetical protein
MIEAVAGGYEKNVLRSRDFEVLAARRGGELAAKD